MSQNEYNYTLHFFISTRFGDPITAIALSKDSFVMGTMMGKSTFYNFTSKQTIIIIKDDTTLECVSDISFIEENLFLVAQGDEAIMRYTCNSNEPSIKLTSKRINNYMKESEHKIACESSYVMLSKNHMLKLKLHPPYEANTIIQTTKVEYITKDFIDEVAMPEQPQPQFIEMTNFSVPLDFNTPYFVWVEYCDENKRNFCVADVFNNEADNIYKHTLDKEFGHISHCKLLKRDRVFIVRKLNVCEIRKVNEEFSIVESFIHIGDEVYAVDVFHNEHKRSLNTESNEDGGLCAREDGNENNKKIMQGNEIMLNMNGGKVETNQMLQHINILSEKTYYVENDKNDNGNSQNNNHQQYMNLNTNSNTLGRNSTINHALVSSTIHNNMNSNNNELENEKIKVVNSKKSTFTIAETYVGECDSENSSEIIIALLDIDGNVNTYEKGKIKKEFNLYDIKQIAKEHKDKQFFAMGYSYYIKFNKHYFLISSDHGCYVIKKEKQTC